MDREYFRARHRLSHDRDYRAVFAARMQKHAGPITVWSRPNGLDEHRLGLTIGRRLGGAVQRNGLKRRLREAFRVIRAGHEGACLDLVVTARPHRLLPGARYRELLEGAWRASEAAWRRRADGAGVVDEG